MSSEAAKRVVRWLEASLLLFVIALPAPGSGNSGLDEKPNPPLRFKSEAMPGRVAGEYIVTLLPGADVALLRKAYGAYRIRAIVGLGGNMFLMKLDKDPGLGTIQRKARESGGVKTVQPNFSYRGN